MPLLLLAATTLWVLSVAAFLYQRAKYARWVQAPGKLLELVRHKSSDGEDTFAPRVSFQTETGETVEFTSEVSSHPAPQFFGPVPVIYPPDQPHRAIVDQPSSRYPMTVFFLVMGLVLFFIHLMEMGKTSAGTP